MRKILSFVFEIVKISLIALAIVIPIRYFLFQPFFVRGESMDPTFENGDYLIIDEITYRFKAPLRGDVVVFQAPSDPSQRYIKRIIGLPGEMVKIQDGQVMVYENSKSEILDESAYLKGVETGGDLVVTLGPDEYFVMGDNRPFSYDSRRFGPINKESIIGRVVIRAWPFDSLTKFEAPGY